MITARQLADAVKEYRLMIDYEGPTPGYRDHERKVDRMVDEILSAPDPAIEDREAQQASQRPEAGETVKEMRKIGSSEGKFWIDRHEVLQWADKLEAAEKDRDSARSLNGIFEQQLIDKTMQLADARAEGERLRQRLRTIATQTDDAEIYVVAKNALSPPQTEAGQ